MKWILRQDPWVQSVIFVIAFILALNAGEIVVAILDVLFAK